MKQPGSLPFDGRKAFRFNKLSQVNILEPQGAAIRLNDCDGNNDRNHAGFGRDRRSNEREGGIPGQR